jgi:hypothetical protein
MTRVAWVCALGPVWVEREGAELEELRAALAALGFEATEKS